MGGLHHRLVVLALLVLLIVAVIPWNSIPVGESPFTRALSGMGFGWGGMAMSIIILTAVRSCMNSAFFVCSRVLFVLAANRDAPNSLVTLNARRVPVRSVWLAAAAGVIGALIAIVSPARVFAFLVNASGALVVFVYMIIAVAHLKLRKDRTAFPWANYTVLGGMTAILIAMLLTPARTNELLISLLALAVTIVAYSIVNHRRRRSI